jgi:hypothetical protein
MRANYAFAVVSQFENGDMYRAVHHSHNWSTAPKAKKTQKSKITKKAAKKAVKKARKSDTQVDRSDIPPNPPFSS